MVKFSDLLVDKSLGGLGTNLRDALGRQFDFHDVIYHIRHCYIDNRQRNMVLQLLDVQNVRRNTHFSLDKSCMKF